MVVLRTAGRRCTARTSPRVADFTVARRRDVLASCSARRPSHTPTPPSRSTPAAALTRDGELLARVVRAAARTRALARGGAALADHAQGADLPADRRHRRRADDVAARAARRRRATGTTATAGCATPRSPSSRCMDGGYSTRRAPGATGCCAPSPARPDAGADHVRRRRRAAAAPSWRCDWLPGYEGSRPVRIGNAAARAVPARRLRRGDRRAAPGAARPACRADEDAWRRCSARMLEHLETRLAAARRRHLGGARRRAGTSPTRR